MSSALAGISISPSSTAASILRSDNLFAAPGPQADVTWPAEYSAWLDHRDRIVHVSAGWDVYAPAEHRRSEILGRPFGWFITDDSRRECFRSLCQRVRREHIAARIVTRCDEEERPRAMRLVFAPQSAGAIEITWSFLPVSVARQIAANGTYRFGERELLRLCGWCHDVRLCGAWHRIDRVAASLDLLDHGPLPGITHGICASCGSAVMAESLTGASLRATG